MKNHVLIYKTFHLENYESQVICQNALGKSDSSIL